MHLHFERTVNAKSDCKILSLTWMGKVPDELPEDEGWKLNRTNYYQEGWLATGNIRGIVGVTFTTSHCKRNVDFPLRTNYNLRGHRSKVILVKWNEPYQKLASCDSSGIIFVWIKYEGRWSIELINDRNTPVTHFSWSHDGRMALICYQDGFVLVGSVAGQRYWSSMLNLDATITCGIWTPDDQQVYFGTTSGQIIVMDVHGAMVSQVQLGSNSDIGITSMAWSCEKFKMEETDENEAGISNGADRSFVLAVALRSGSIYFLTTFDDVSPVQIKTGLGPLCMEWSNSREFLAVCGVSHTLVNINPEMSEDMYDIEYTNQLKFYNDKGVLIYSTVIPDSSAQVSTLTWGHNDKRLFLAIGCQIHIAWVSKRIASLQLLCRLRIHDLIPQEVQLSSLPLPIRLRNIIGNLFAQTIRCCVPEPTALREFVSRPPMGSVRLHCTMIRHDDETNLTSGTCYTLYLEYLGGLVPLLKGKRTSKIRPEFVIYDPQEEEFHHYSRLSKEMDYINSTSGSNAYMNSSDTDHEDGCTGSPRMPRRRKKRYIKLFQAQAQANRSNHYSSEDGEDFNGAYYDTLPEHVRLVEVTSNIWGTKFKIHGLASCVPANLGQVTYKTSLLHLQPRQMTLVMTELRDDFPIGPDPTFHPNLFSEDEEDAPLEEKLKTPRLSLENCPPIAPMSPRGNLLTSKPKCSYMDAIATVQESDVAPPEPPPIRPSTSPSSSAIIGTTTSFIGQFGGASAISPIFADVSVPALQSPKNAVAPRDTIFERPQPCTSSSKKPEDLRFIDEDHTKIDSMVRSCSVGYLDMVDAHFIPSDSTLMLLQKDIPKRLVLVNKKPKTKRQNRNSRHLLEQNKNLKNCGKSRSLDSSDIFPHAFELGTSGQQRQKVIYEVGESSVDSTNNNNNNNEPQVEAIVKKESKPSRSSRLDFLASPLMRRKHKTKKNDVENLNNNKKNDSLHSQALANLEKLITRLKEDDSTSGSASPRLPRSSPASPTPTKKGVRPQSASPIRRKLLNSPLLGRKNRKSKNTESSDDEVTASGDETNYNSTYYKDLETFQKSQLRQKLKRGKIEPNGSSCNTPIIPQRREFVMHNKAPMWNENSQVYQLDFGGRVTQESAKNFQIEFRGKQVMQFGRIDGNAYTLDFQYPFSALQAFAVALANVTQRLK